MLCRKISRRAGGNSCLATKATAVAGLWVPDVQGHCVEADPEDIHSSTKLWLSDSFLVIFKSLRSESISLRCVFAEKPNLLLGPAFGRTDFSRIFIFEPPDFFADFLAGFFSSFLWEKVPRKILRENPRQNPPKFIQQKSSNTFLQTTQGNYCEPKTPLTKQTAREDEIFVNSKINLKGFANYSAIQILKHSLTV